tara:strand:+ start:53 stop:331 length:279 start_codon:yes stop_codon:yes gene_type:complete
MTIEKTAMALYTPPFKYQHGYIYDSAGNMFADDSCEREEVVEADEEGNLALRVRGWGRLQYLKTEFDNGDIQDELGRLIAKALTKYWEAYRQ